MRPRCSPVVPALLVVALSSTACEGISADPQRSAALESPAPDAAGAAAPAPSITADANARAAASTVAPPPAHVAHLAFVGDLALALHVKSYLDGDTPGDPPLEPGYPFGFVRERLRAYDLLVGNLECVVTTRGAATRAQPLHASLRTPDVLRDAGFDVLSVANNHAHDFGDDGYEQTVRRLREVGLDVAGEHLAVVAKSPFVVREVAGIRVAIVGHFNREHDRAVRDVRAAKAVADVVVVFEHWGADFVATPERSQRVLGHDLVDAGAEVVVGAHAHVVQPEESYHGKLIAHGLGNFVFTGMTEPGSRTGALLELDLDARGLIGHRYRSIRIDERGSPRFVGDATAEPTLDPPGNRSLR